MTQWNKSVTQLEDDGDHPCRIHKGNAGLLEAQGASAIVLTSFACSTCGGTSHLQRSIASSFSLIRVAVRARSCLAKRGSLGPRGAPLLFSAAPSSRHKDACQGGTMFRTHFSPLHEGHDTTLMPALLGTKDKLRQCQLLGIYGPS